MVTRPAPAPPTGFRPHMPIGVKLKACLYLLFGEEAEVDFDHNPPLKLRVWDPEAKNTIPAANDHKYIEPMLRTNHRAKTASRKGNATTRGQDVAEIAKTKRLAKATNALADALIGKKCGEPVKRKTKTQWPKQKLQSRNTFRRKPK